MKMRLTARLVILFAIGPAALLSSPATAESPATRLITSSDIGRFFFSPEERAQLSMIRKKAAPPAPEPRKTKRQTAPKSTVQKPTTLKGFVARKQTTTNVWLESNGTTRNVSTSTLITDRVSENQSLRFDSSPIALKVGQRYDSSKRDKDEAFKPTSTKNVLIIKKSAPSD